MNNTSIAEATNDIYKYLAGFVDADGSISIINRKGGKYRIALTVYNCNIEVSNIFNKYLGTGNSRSKLTGKGKNHINWRRCIEWRILDKKASYAIEKMLPYLIIKRSQAKIVLFFQKVRDTFSAVQKRWNPILSELTKDIFEELKISCNLLNERGSQNTTMQPYINEKLSPEYVAGFVDADGSIQIIKIKQYFRAKICITNTNKNIMDLFILTFRMGRLYKKIFKNIKWKNAYEWSLTCNNALILINKIKKFLIIKKQQALLFCKFQDNKNKYSSVQRRWNKDFSLEISNLDQILYNEIKILNKRGS
jgi:hypothetical protein